MCVEDQSSRAFEAKKKTENILSLSFFFFFSSFCLHEIVRVLVDDLIIYLEDHPTTNRKTIEVQNNDMIDQKREHA